MKKLIKYLKPYTLLAVLCVIAVFCQAMGELKLPDYMSHVVNVGVQRYGIEDGVAVQIGSDTFHQLSLLMTADQQKAAAAVYEERDNVMYLKDNITDEEHTAAAEGLTPAFAILYGLQSGETGMDADKLLASLAAMDDTQREAALKKATGAFQDRLAAMEGQLCALGVRAEYDRIGMDATSIQRQSILRTGAKMLAVALLITLAGVSAGYLASRIAAGFSRDLRADVYTRTLSFSGAEMDRFSTASLITRTTNDVQQIQMVVMLGFRIVLFAPFMGVGAIIYALRKSTSLIWVLALAILVLLCVIAVLFTAALPKFKRLQSLVDRLNQVARENLSGVMVSRAYNAQSFEKQRFDGANKDVAKTTLFVNRLMSAAQPFMFLLMNGVTLMIVWFGGKLIADSSLQIGDMMAYLQYAMQVVMSFMFISMIFIFLPRAAVSMKRIAEVLDTEPVIRDPEHPADVSGDPNRHGVVEFRDVSFSYPGAEAPTLKHISFQALPGQMTAIIGATGSGKSTLLNLIPRIYDASEGQVLVNGVDVRSVRQHDLRTQIGYAPQKALLFTGTIGENLRLGAAEASDEQVLRAAETAQAASFIAEKEAKMNEPIAQGGTNVSGGQRQRLSVARALVPGAQILLFDDTFSALDFKTDAALRRALSTEAAEKTLLVVAQRVGTIRSAQQIIVLDEGEIVGRGTHKELMESCPIYREIARSQLRAEAPARAITNGPPSGSPHSAALPVPAAAPAATE